MTQIPQSKDCGPVEALNKSEEDQTSTSRIPQSKDCGPVEAAFKKAATANARMEFRSRKTAAPLKRSLQRDRASERRDEFRSRKTAAPLKHRFAELISGLVEGIPQSKDCGPVEARMDGRAGDWLSGNSAVERLRPR